MPDSRSSRYDLISPQLYGLVYLLIVEREGLATSSLSLSLSLASLSRLSLSLPNTVSTASRIRQASAI